MRPAAALAELFAVKFAPISAAMAEQKIANAMDTGADYIISTDLSCLMQIDAVCRKEGLPLKNLAPRRCIGDGLVICRKKNI